MKGVVSWQARGRVCGLLNLGGPERIEDVGPFLLQPVFGSESIIRLPIPAYKGLCLADQHPAHGKSQDGYRSIRWGFPLRRHSPSSKRVRTPERTAPTPRSRHPLYVAMRYLGIRSRESAVAQSQGLMPLMRWWCFPLYPHFSDQAPAAPASGSFATPPAQATRNSNRLADPLHRTCTTTPGYVAGPWPKLGPPPN